MMPGQTMTMIKKFTMMPMIMDTTIGQSNEDQGENDERSKDY